ncbi:phytanoyl-CoA dioxygenase family protein [Sphingomonas sp. R647]|uniref:phytanoyl-CoA dioxygenase family protein n=1 Tax=Sphingomonas sp. R647 TaxID=2875233 RepID=UPI001CD6002C|nr:phytanoyl-CoA dioxygenase family protein [Sphingomonas sp. R647]MCA1196502.1 phytanoyl-CoA dioxygenase family protein [Sphingomonas sp. R647]
MTRLTHRRSSRAIDACHQLDAQGWTILRGLAPQRGMRDLAADLEPVFEATPFCTGDFYGARTKRFGSLLRRSGHVSPLVLAPDILEIVEHFLLPWCDNIQLNLGQAIALYPGAPAQFPHRDQDMWQGVKGEVEYLVNIMWPLTPFTARNGATLIYPGTHRRNALEDTIADASICAECEPGDAIVFLGSTLHGAGANRTDTVRKAVVLSYCLGWLKPYENQWLAYPPSVARTFPADLAALVGYRQHRPNLGNFEGVCPSVLLQDMVPAHLGAIDALRPDQAIAVTGHLAAQATG